MGRPPSVRSFAPPFGLARRFVASGIELSVVVVEIVGRLGSAAIALGLARASQDGLTRRFVASGHAVLEALIVLAVSLLLLQVEVVNSVVLLGDGGSLHGPIIRIVFELDGPHLAVVLGSRLRPDEA